MTDNTAHIQQMAATLAIVASAPVATEEEIGPEGADQEGSFSEPPADATVSMIEATNEPFLTDDGDADPASAIVIVDETMIGAGELDGSSADTHGDTLDPADTANRAPNDTGDGIGIGIGIEAPVSSEASKPASAPRRSDRALQGVPGRAP